MVWFVVGLVSACHYWEWYTQSMLSGGEKGPISNFTHFYNLWIIRPGF